MEIIAKQNLKRVVRVVLPKATLQLKEGLSIRMGTLGNKHRQSNKVENLKSLQKNYLFAQRCIVAHFCITEWMHRSPLSIYFTNTMISRYIPLSDFRKEFAIILENNNSVSVHYNHL